MASEENLNAIREFLTELQRERGQLNLAFALADYENENTSFTLFLSASWIDALGVRESMGVIIPKMRTMLGKNVSGVVNRVTLINTEDPMKYVFPCCLEDSTVSLHDVVLNGVYVKEAYLFECRPSQSSVKD